MIASLVLSAALSTFSSPSEVLTEFFKHSKKLDYISVSMAQLREAEDILRYRLNNEQYIFVAFDHDGKVDGYAIIDRQKGQHLPFDYAIKFSPMGFIQRIEVLVYRERYGGDIKQKRYLKQYLGKTWSDDFKDIDAVSGATLSCKAMSTGVRRALVLLHIVTKGL